MILIKEFEGFKDNNPNQIPVFTYTLIDNDRMWFFKTLDEAKYFLKHGIDKEEIEGTADEILEKLNER